MSPNVVHLDKAINTSESDANGKPSSVEQSSVQQGSDEKTLSAAPGTEADNPLSTTSLNRRHWLGLVAGVVGLAAVVGDKYLWKEQDTTSGAAPDVSNLQSFDSYRNEALLYCLPGRLKSDKDAIRNLDRALLGALQVICDKNLKDCIEEVSRTSRTGEDPEKTQLWKLKNLIESASQAIHEARPLLHEEVREANRTKNWPKDLATWSTIDAVGLFVNDAFHQFYREDGLPSSREAKANAVSSLNLAKKSMARTVSKFE